MKFWTDIEARRIFYTRQKYSREWPLLHNIFWNLKGIEKLIVCNLQIKYSISLIDRWCFCMDYIWILRFSDVIFWNQYVSSMLFRHVWWYFNGQKLEFYALFNFCLDPSIVIFMSYVNRQFQFCTMLNCKKAYKILTINCCLKE